ncbi:lipoprotein insertase outer membrane protein LolB [Kaarinaea lacus]
MFNKSFYLIILLAVTVTLTACSTLTTDSESVPDKVDQAKAVQLLEQRQQQLQSILRWQFNGRFSFVTDSEAWSGRLHWQQQADHEYFIQFSDPAGQGAMQLLGNEGMVELRLADGKSYQAEDAETLLRREANWDLPIQSLWYWIRGLPDPGLPLKNEMDDQGLPAKFDQGGWIVNFHSYHQVDNRYFPRKIVIEKAAMKLKLIIMNWIVE